MSTNTNATIVTWTVRGVRHDRVKYLTNGPEGVVCCDTCRCKRVAS